jgi:hypothetical protein
MELGGAQQVFARWLDLGTKLALVLLTASFAVYVTGLVPAQLPPEALAKLWGLPLREYLAAAGAPVRWDWLPLAGRGDYLNYAGIVLLVSIVALAYLRMLPPLARHAPAFAAIATLEILVLLMAASGLLN